MTWESRIHDDSITREERRELYEEFTEEIEADVRKALEDAELSREFAVETGKHHVVVWGDDWKMGEADAEELRDAIGEWDVGDVSVGVFVEEGLEQYYVEFALKRDIELMDGVLEGE
jgi:hypothetical protein